MPVTLTLKRELSVPVDARCVSPDAFAGKTLDEIAKLHAWEGNRKRVLGELFALQGSSGNAPSEVEIRVVGNLSRAQRIGSGMTGGQIVIQGDVGMHLGAEMKGGRVTAEGAAGSWAGSAMKGGTIEVKKDAGDYIGAGYRGSTQGMRGGAIIIHGNAGTEVGGHMHKGLIRIFGNVGQFVGIHMKKGAIIVHGNVGERAGAFMTGGKIILCGHIPSILPSFTFDSLKGKAKAQEEKIGGPFYLFVGDLTERGSGKLYVSKDKNPYLKAFEEFLQ